jgi:hypothetical protein
LLAEEMFDSLVEFNVVLSHHRDGFSRATCARCSTDAMNVVLAVCWDVVVQHNVDVGDVQTSEKGKLVSESVICFKIQEENCANYQW